MKVAENYRYWVPKVEAVYMDVCNVVDDVRAGKTDPDQFPETTDYIVAGMHSTPTNTGPPPPLPERTIVSSTGTSHTSFNSATFEGPLSRDFDPYGWWKNV